MHASKGPQSSRNRKSARDRQSQGTPRGAHSSRESEVGAGMHRRLLGRFK